MSAQNGQGWVKLWRQSLDSRVWQNPNLWRVWCWCLLRANREARWVAIPIGRATRTVHVEAGELVCGRHTGAAECRMPASTFRNMIAKLTQMGNITVNPDTHFSVITVVKWADYQRADTPEGQQMDTTRTTEGQQKDTKRTPEGQQKDTDKKDKKSEKDKKGEKKTGEPSLPRELDTPAFREAWADWVAYRTERKLPQYVPRGMQMLWTKLARLGVGEAIAAIENSIAMNYNGIWPEKSPVKRSEAVESGEDILKRLKAKGLLDGD